MKKHKQSHTGLKGENEKNRSNAKDSRSLRPKVKDKTQMDPNPSLFRGWVPFIFLLLFILFVPGILHAQASRQWATYYGGTNNDEASSTATDAAGNVYLSGATRSTNAIASGGFQNTYGGGTNSFGGYTMTGDAYLVKFDAAGNRLWATYYGGANDDYSYSIATDAAGNVYLAGATQSAAGIASGGFQNTFGGVRDAFLVKFNAAGNRLWATYYGGAGDDCGYSVATDAAGNVYLAGTTESTSNIASGGFQNTFGGGRNAFLVKFNAATGSRLWATYYGGSSIYDYGYGVATDAAGNVYLGGTAGSTTGIASGGFQNTFGGTTGYGGDAFLVKFDAAGNRLWATYYGGAYDDYGLSVATDAAGSVYLGGQTTGSTTGISSNGFQNTFAGGNNDVFLVKFDGATGNRLWGTYYGGPDDDRGASVATDVSGNVYLAGLTISLTGIASGGFQNTFIGGYNGAYDAFLVKFNSSGSRLCATYYGPVKSYGGSYVAVDKSENVYLAGTTLSLTGIEYKGFQNAHGGGKNDAYLVKFCTCSGCIFSATAISTDVCPGKCDGTATAVPSNGTPPYTYSWTTTPTQITQTLTGLCPGTYSVLVTDATGSSLAAAVTVATDSSCCSIPASVSSDPSSTVCAGAQVYVSASGGITYSWSTGDASANIVITPTVTTTYSVTVTDASGCTGIGTITIPVDTGCTATGILLLNNPSFPISIWPNPSNGMFVVTDYRLQASGLEIYNVMGKKVYSDEIVPRTPYLVHSSLPNGIYFIYIKTDSETISQKIIIQK